MSTEHELIQETFRQMDINHDGKLQDAELEEFLRHAFSPVSPSEVHRLFQTIDTNGDGEISFDEFVTLFQKLDGHELVSSVNTAVGEEYLRSLFNQIDVNGDGSLEADEIRHLMVSHFLPNETQVQDLKQFVYTMAGRKGRIDGVSLYQITDAVNQFGGCLRTVTVNRIKNLGLGAILKDDDKTSHSSHSL